MVQSAGDHCPVQMYRLPATGYQYTDKARSSGSVGAAVQGAAGGRESY